MVMREANDPNGAVCRESESKSSQRPRVHLRERPSAGIEDAPRVLAIVAASFALALAGCAPSAAPAPTVRPLMVQVPVLHETPCPAPTLADPALPIASLKSEPSPADTMRAYAASIAILKGAVRQRDAVLAGCARADRPASAQPENIQ